jgi:hypothetical protein
MELNYSGGLDVRQNNKGTHSVYTNWNGFEVMSHVSTLLPFNGNDREKAPGRPGSFCSPAASEPVEAEEFVRRRVRSCNALV